jgi:hypothetical protein
LGLAFQADVSSNKDLTTPKLLFESCCAPMMFPPSPNGSSPCSGTSSQLPSGSSTRGMHMHELIGDFNLITYKTTHGKHGVYDCPQLPWQTYIQHILSIKASGGI